MVTDVDAADRSLHPSNELTDQHAVAGADERFPANARISARGDGLLTREVNANRVVGGRRIGGGHHYVTAVVDERVDVKRTELVPFDDDLDGKPRSPASVQIGQLHAARRPPD
jgi:hypothetical protein